MYRFYHSCPKTDTASILKDGLLRSKSSLWKASGGALYLTKDACWFTKGEHNLLQIDLPDEFVKATEIWHIDAYDDPGENWQYVCWRDIPSQYIKISIKEKEKMSRLSWDEYFMKIVEDVSERAICIKRKVGAVIVKDNRILSTGYNGAPKGFDHCTEETCLRKKMNIPSGQRHELCRGLHAEQNAIIQAAWHGVKIERGTIYCNYQPCVICVKMLINAGIKRLVYSGGYPDKLAEEMLTESDIVITKFGDCEHDFEKGTNPKVGAVKVCKICKKVEYGNDG